MIGTLTSIDYFAACLIVAGMVCQLFHRRIPAGLGTSLFVGATTVGVGLAAGAHVWSFARTEQMWLRVLAGLCLLWAFFGWLAARPKPATSLQAWEEPKPARSPSPSAIDARRQGGGQHQESTLVLEDAAAKVDSISPAATFLAWSLVTGIAAVVIAFYSVVFHTWHRVVDPETLGAGLLWSGGLWDLVALLGAVAIWRAVVIRPSQPVAVLALAALGVWWTSLALPVASSATEAGELRPMWWDWTFHLQFGLAVLLAGAAVIQDLRYRARRRIAPRPDAAQLDQLLEPYSRWPAYIQLESTIAAAVLILGVYQLVRSGPPSAALGLAGLAACGVTGTTCLFMTYRRWSGNTAGLGIALLTLAVVMLLCTLAQLIVGDSTAGYGERMPVVFVAILFALALMIAWWGWLARFWDQQLLDGVPWTTTGRMIGHAKQATFLLGALAVLVAFQLALWPSYMSRDDEDFGAVPMSAGLLAIGAAALVIAVRACREDKSTIAGLAVALMVGGVIFLFLRMPASPLLRGWIKQYDQVVLGSVALPILVIAESLPRTGWRCFAAPLWLLALLVLPVWSLGELLRPGLPAEWVRPLTLAVLGALYSFAGSREHRRAFLVLGGVLVLAALISVYRAFGSALF
jgi:hypothetical protein